MDVITPWTTDEERWRQLKLHGQYDQRRRIDAPGYVVSNLGRVGRIGVIAGRGVRQTGDYILTPVWCSGTATVKIQGRRWTIPRLVAYAFLDAPDGVDYWYIGFKDSDHENFRPENLEWRLRTEWRMKQHGR